MREEVIRNYGLTTTSSSEELEMRLGPLVNPMPAEARNIKATPINPGITERDQREPREASPTNMYEMQAE